VVPHQVASIIRHRLSRPRSWSSYLASHAAPVGNMNDKHHYLRAILLGGSIAGIIDIGAACLITMAGPFFILHAVASGILGRASFSGGNASAALGGLLQLAMSIIIAAIYVAASAILPRLRERWLPSGLVYGVIVFCVMNYVVVPLSAVGHFPHFTAISFVGNLLAMLLFGTIVALFARAPGARQYD